MDHFDVEFKAVVEKEAAKILCLRIFLYEPQTDYKNRKSYSFEI